MLGGSPSDGIFGWNPSVDYSVGGRNFTWELDTFLDRVFGRDGESLSDVPRVLDQQRDAVVESIEENMTGVVDHAISAVGPWVQRGVFVILAFLLIAGAFMLLSKDAPAAVANIAKEAVA